MNARLTLTIISIISLHAFADNPPAGTGGVKDPAPASFESKVKTYSCTEMKPGSGQKVVLKIKAYYTKDDMSDSALEMETSHQTGKLPGGTPILEPFKSGKFSRKRTSGIVDTFEGKITTEDGSSHDFNFELNKRFLFLDPRRLNNSAVITIENVDYVCRIELTT